MKKKIKAKVITLSMLPELLDVLRRYAERHTEGNVSRAARELVRKGLEETTKEA